jgi:hypothetical protein
MAKPNGKIRAQIVSVMTNLAYIKQTTPDDVNHHSIPDIKINLVESQLFDQEIVTKEKPNLIVLKAKEFVDKVKKQNLVEYWNRGLYYYPTQRQMSETGVIDYIELLLKKM